jgi:triosephosphate isomerase (TIM)
MRKKIIAGNWKMNADKSEAVALINGILDQYEEFNLSARKEVVIAPPFPYVHYCSSMFVSYPHLFAAAQNCSEHENGAYTGEVSALMLASLDVKYIIIGHSERRLYFKEDDVMLLSKIKQVLHHQLTPVFCCGEPLEIREQQNHFQHIFTQLQQCIFQLSEAEINRLVIAYEPVWAIGTGRTATPEQAEEVHAFIRNKLAEHYNQSVADNMTILYGGSVNAKNASDLFSSKHIDGGLVGGASLKADEFCSIIKAME